MPYELPNKDELSDAYKALLATLGNKIGPYVQDYGQLIEKGSPLNNQYQQLKSNISQHIPSNADFRSPQAMSEWSQAAALNAPMGLAVMGSKQLKDVVKELTKSNPSTLPKIPAGNVFKNQVAEAPLNARLAADDYFLNNKSPVQQSINVSDIYPTQRNINIENLKKINEVTDNPTLINIDGKYYVTDGHHRISRDILSGDEKISGNVFNYSNKLPSTPFSKAHDVAQKNAALPIEQGGLGLPLNNTAMDRARAMGFDTDAYHGTTHGNINEFLPDGGNKNSDTLEWYKKRKENNDPIGYMQFRKGSFFSPKSEYANNYTGEGMGSMYPVKIKTDNPLHLYSNKGSSYEVLKGPEKTMDAMILHNSPDINDINEISIIDPAQIRSRFAAFDPMKKDSANILATTLMGMLLGSQYNENQNAD